MTEPRTPILGSPEGAEALREKLAEAKAEAQDWLLIADGIKHDPRCMNHFMGDERFGPCHRCENQALREQLERAERERDEARRQGDAAINEVWDDVLAAVQRAWDEPQSYADCPTELIARLIGERDELKAGAERREAALRMALLQITEVDSTRKPDNARAERMATIARAALASPAPPAPRRRRGFDCDECGPGIAVDEDGCCRTCGADATPFVPLQPHRSRR